VCDHSKLRSEKLQAVVPIKRPASHLSGYVGASDHSAMSIAAMTAAAHSKPRQLELERQTRSNRNVPAGHAAGKLSAVAAAPGIKVSTGLFGNVYVVKFISTLVVLEG